MASNRYTNLRPTEYNSMYVPLPFNELAAIGETQQKKYDEGKAMPFALQNLYQTLKAAPGHEQWKEEKIGEYAKQMEDLVNKTKDYGSFDFKNRAQSIISNFKNDQDIQKIQSSYNWYEKQYVPYKSDIKNQKDIDFTLPYDQTGNVVQNKNPYYQLNAVKYSDPVKDADFIMKDIKAIGKEFDGFDKNSDGSLKVVDGYFTKKGSKVKQITPEMVKAIASSNIGTFANTEGGNFLIAQTLQNLGLNPSTPYNQLDDKIAIGTVKTTDGKGKIIEKPITLKAYVDQQLENQLVNTGKKQIFKETGYSEDIREDFKSKSDYERKSSGQTSIVSSGSTGFTVNKDQFIKNKQDFKTSLDVINNQIKNTKDPVIVAQLEKDKKNLEGKIRMQNDLLNSIEQKSNWNWDQEYGKFIAKLVENKTGKKYFDYAESQKMITQFPKAIFKNLVRGESNMYDTFPQIMGEQTAESEQEYYKLMKQLAPVAGQYEKLLQNPEGKEFGKQFSIVLGNESTFTGQFTKRLQDAIDKGAVEMLNLDASQFNLGTAFENLDASSLKVTVLPTKNMWGGKPVFAVTGVDNNGDKEVYYTTMDEDSSMTGDYRQMGVDMIEQSNTSKFASDPVKSQELRNTGYMQLGYGVLGKQINDAQLHTMKNGDTRDIQLDNGTLKITAKGDAGLVYYNAELDNVKIYDNKGNVVKVVNDIPLEGNFGNEETLLKSFGENYYQTIKK